MAGEAVIGDQFHIANYGDVRVDGDFSSGLVGVGTDGDIVNCGIVDSASFGSTAVFQRWLVSLREGGFSDRFNETDCLRPLGLLAKDVLGRRTSERPHWGGTRDG
jgi:hypothetical protein